MYFPKLISLITDKDLSNYSEKIIAKVDDYLGSSEQGTSFNESDLNIVINDVFLTEKILKDLVELEIVEEYIEDEIREDGDDEMKGKKFILLMEPNKQKNKHYEEYINKKRKINSFAIILERAKEKNSGVLILVDLKGYSKNINNENTNPIVLSLINKIQKAIDDSIKPYFFNSYSGIEIKRNGDGWFLYFFIADEAYEFLGEVLRQCKEDSGIKNDFKTLSTSLKCYIHYAAKIEKAHEVDTLHFDLEGKDVIQIHMLEKPIEKALYNGVISKESNFIAITEKVFEKINSKYTDFFKELKKVDLEIKDSDGNNKINESNMKIFYKEYV